MVFLTNCTKEEEVNNKEPILKIVSPSNKLEVVKGDSIFIEAEAIDPDGSIETIQFNIDDNLIYQTDIPPYTHTWDTDTVSEGIYSISVDAIDNRGISSSESVVVYIKTEVPEIEVLYTDLSPGINLNCVLRYDTVLCTYPEGTFIIPYPGDTIVDYLIDINHDTIVDFNVNVSTNTYWSSYCMPSKNITISGLNRNEVLKDYWADCHPLTIGDTINYNNDHWDQYYSLYDYAPGAHFHSCYDTQYAGVRLFKEGQYYYGWVQFEIPESKFQMTILGYAISSKPHSEIIVD